MSPHRGLNDVLRDTVPLTFSPSPDSHRGRKRDRSVTRADTGPGEAGGSGGSGESRTLRGRARRRSTSPVWTSSRNPSGGPMDGSLSSGPRRSLRVMVLDRRRSQSPSRSGSPNRRAMRSRRRQRTRSRSRSHQAESYRGDGREADVKHAHDMVSKQAKPAVDTGMALDPGGDETRRERKMD